MYLFVFYSRPMSIQQVSF